MARQSILTLMMLSLAVIFLGSSAYSEEITQYMKCEAGGLQIMVDPETRSLKGNTYGRDAKSIDGYKSVDYKISNNIIVMNVVDSSGKKYEYKLINFSCASFPVK